MQNKWTVFYKSILYDHAAGTKRTHNTDAPFPKYYTPLFTEQYITLSAPIRGKACCDLFLLPVLNPFSFILYAPCLQLASCDLFKYYSITGPNMPKPIHSLLRDSLPITRSHSYIFSTKKIMYFIVSNYTVLQTSTWNNPLLTNALTVRAY